MLVASYNISGCGIEIKICSNYNGKFLPFQCDKGYLNDDIIFERCEGSFNLLPSTVESLVLVNTHFTPLYNLKMLADMGREYARKVTIISPTVARINYVLKGLTERDIPDGSYVVIITPTMFHAELLIIQNRNRSIYPIFKRVCDKTNVYNVAEEVAEDFQPDLVIIYYHIKYHERVFDILPNFDGRVFISFNRFFHDIYAGGLEMAASVIGKSYWNVINFSTGIDAYYSMGNYFITSIVPFGALFPFNVKQLDHCASHTVRYGDEVVCQHGLQDIEHSNCFMDEILYPENNNKILFYFDEDGIPYPADLPELFSVKRRISSFSTRFDENRSETATYLEERAFHYNDNNQGFDYVENNEINSSYSTIIITEDNLCGIEVKNRNKRMMLKIDGDDWIPSYISWKSGRAVVGKIAESDYYCTPESVVFDIFNLIDKTYDEVERDLKWGFDIERRINTDSFIFIVKHIGGTRRIILEIAVFVILDFLKKIIQDYVCEVNYPIYVKVERDLNERAKEIMNKACKNIGLLFIQ